jgi:hypothetical protein
VAEAASDLSDGQAFSLAEVARQGDRAATLSHTVVALTGRFGSHACRV